MTHAETKWEGTSYGDLYQVSRNMVMRSHGQRSMGTGKPSGRKLLNVLFDSLWFWDPILQMRILLYLFLDGCSAIQLDVRLWRMKIEKSWYVCVSTTPAQ
jgi:hypothetical protein